jgi:hypothetical protein
MAIIYYLVWQGNDNIWDGCEFNYTVLPYCYKGGIDSAIFIF